MNTRLDWRKDMVWLFAAIAAFYCIGLGIRPYLAPSEARYIEIPLQMLATGDWITPHINGVKYFEKPPLFYWIEAAQIYFFGVGEFAARVPAMLCVVLTCLITYGMGRMLYGRLSGLLAACVLATCLLGYGLSRVAVLDVPVTLFITATMGCFLAAKYGKGKSVYWYYAMYGCAALAMLTKGLIGVVLPGLIVCLWMLLTRQWFILREARIPTGLLLFLAIAAPWHVLVQQRNPEFMHFYFIHEHLERFATDEHKRNAPWWFFIAVTLAGLMPWTVFLPATLHSAWRQRKTDARTLFLLLWAAVPLVFFSLSHSKLVPYIFPIFPPLALLLANALLDMQERTVRKTLLALALLLLALGAAYVCLPVLSVKKQLMAEAIHDQMRRPMMWAVTAALAFFLILWRRWSITGLLAGMGVFALGFDMFLNLAAAHADVTSVKPVAEFLKARLQPTDEVITYDTYYQDLPVYLGRNVTVAGWTGELGFGMQHDQDTQRWMISEAEFLSRCATTQHVMYVVMPKRYYPQFQAAAKCTLQPLTPDEQNIILSNQP